MMQSLSILLPALLAALVDAKWNGQPPPSPTALLTSYVKSVQEPAVTEAPSAGNPFQGAEIYANKNYASEVLSLAIPSMANADLAAKASAVAKIPTFYWLDKMETIKKIPEFVADAKGQTIPLVVYNLPERDCAALASNGELSLANGGEAKYKEYIDSIKKEIQAASSTKFILAIEPDSLANLVTNINEQKCRRAQNAYKTLTNYAIKALDLPNVSMYLDAGHAGWLGWDANLAPAANLFAEIYNKAGKPKAVRGLATNIANYNAWTLGSCPTYAETNKVCDEKKFVHALGPLLQQKGFPAKFIVDTSRSGVQPTRQIKWGNWCNVIGTGFGTRPTANTGDDLVDAFAWIKPGGEADGTSDKSAKRYDAHCGSEDALKPAPEAGSWFQAYFEQLLTNANPPF